MTLKIGIMILIALVIAVGIFIVLYMIKPGTVNPEAMKVFQGWRYAHRGLYDNEGGIPENTLAAQKRAIDYGFAFELDVQLTKDDQLVVFHDKTLKRMCGVSKNLYNCTFEELQTYPLKGSEHRIPLFKDVLAQLDGQVPLVIEVKDYHKWKDIVHSLCTYIDSYKGDYCIVSFSPYVLRWFRINRPNVIRGQITEGMGNLKWKWGKGKKKFIKKFLAKFLLSNFIGRPQMLSYKASHYHNIAYMLCRLLYKPYLLHWPNHSEEDLKRFHPERDMYVFEWFLPEKTKNPKES